MTNVGVELSSGAYILEWPDMYNGPVPKTEGNYTELNSGIQLPNGIGFDIVVLDVSKPFHFYTSLNTTYGSDFGTPTTWNLYKVLPGEIKILVYTIHSGRFHITNH